MCFNATKSIFLLCPIKLPPNHQQHINLCFHWSYRIGICNSDLGNEVASHVVVNRPLFLWSEKSISPSHGLLRQFILGCRTTAKLIRRGPKLLVPRKCNFYSKINTLPALFIQSQSSRSFHYQTVWWPGFHISAAWNWSALQRETEYAMGWKMFPPVHSVFHDAACAYLFLALRKHTSAAFSPFIPPLNVIRCNAPRLSAFASVYFQTRRAHIKSTLAWYRTHQICLHAKICKNIFNVFRGRYSPNILGRGISELCIINT